MSLCVCVCVCSVCLCVRVQVQGEFARVLLADECASCLSEAQQVFSLAHRCLFFISENIRESGATC